MEWVLFTFLAAFMQSVRTAGQKSLSNKMSAMATTWVRYGFGLPFVIVYLVAVWFYSGKTEVSFNSMFFFFAGIASIFQIWATLLLVKVLSLRNFAVGTTYAKTEAILTAVIGVLVFSASLSFAAWFSILIGLIGTLLVSIHKGNINLKAMFTSRSLVYGIGAGLGFALTSLCLREASLSLQLPYLLSAAVTLCFMVALQAIIAGLWLAHTEISAWRAITTHWKPAVFVGLTSALGSIGWFTAMTFEDAAYVKALGQVEFVFTLVITYKVFKESISRTEWIGMILTLIAVMFLLIDRI